MDHVKSSDKERRVLDYCLDYCFPGDEFGHKLTVLSGSERLSGAKMSVTVPMKGTSGKYAIDKILEFMQENGDADNRVIIKNDQEPSIQVLIKDLLREREDGRTILEESPVKSSGGNEVEEGEDKGKKGKTEL